MEKLFADVIVDISSEKLDRSFQYRIPDSLAGQVKPGVQVWIPFGNGGRTIRGYVIQVTDRPACPVEKMKEICRIAEDQNNINSRMIALAAWMRENYGSTMIQALKTVLPVKQKTRQKEERWITLGISRREAEEQLEVYRKKHHVARERVLQAVLEEETVSYSLVRDKLHVTSQVLKTMEEQGILKIRSRRVYRNPVAHNEQGGGRLRLTESQQETADAIVTGTRNILTYARDHGVRSVVYVSSMEVYGDGNPEPGLDAPLDESSVGSSDVMQVRSCYPEGKRMAEAYCAAFASEYGVNVKTARLAQTFGPGIPSSDTRLFAQVARAAMNDADIVLKTTGESTRMYVYIADAVSAILTLLTRGDAGHSYNVANPETYSSVRGMAEQILDRFGRGDGKVVIDVDPTAPYPPEHHLPLDVSALRSVGWHPKVGLDEMYGRLIEYLADFS